MVAEARSWYEEDDRNVVVIHCKVRFEDGAHKNAQERLTCQTIPHRLAKAGALS